jgi:hypothetical protein
MRKTDNMSLQAHEKLETDRNEILPLRRAEGVQTFGLFWMPARFAPMPEVQREWLTVFLRRLERSVMQTLRLEKLQFMQERTIRKNEAMQEKFHRKLHRYAPVPGQSRSLNQPPRVKLTPEVRTAFARNRKNPSIEPFMSELAFRFRRDDGGEFTEAFMGFGGMTLLFCGDSSEEMAPQMQLPQMQKVSLPKFLRKYTMLQTMTEEFDPQAPGRMPAFLRNHPSMQPLKSDLGVDLESDNASMRMDTFGKKSKDIFGEPIQNSPGFEGLAFILPRLTTQDFLSLVEEEVRKWFEVFDVYIRESPEDEGFVIASKHDLRPIFREVLETMRTDGYVYWEG